MAGRVTKFLLNPARREADDARQVLDSGTGIRRFHAFPTVDTTVYGLLGEIHTGERCTCYDHAEYGHEFLADGREIVREEKCEEHSLNGGHPTHSGSDEVVLMLDDISILLMQEDPVGVSQGPASEPC